MPNGKMMNPAANAIETGQHRSDDAAFHERYEKKLRLDRQLALDYSARLVPWRIVGKDLAPQRDDRLAVVEREWSYFNPGHAPAPATKGR